MKTVDIRSEKGGILVMSVILSFSLFLMGLGFLKSVDTYQKYISSEVTILQAFYAAKANLALTKAEISKGNIISADGMLYCYTERGELALLSPNPQEFNLISKTKVLKGTEQHWAHPVIHRGVLYLRHGNAMLAYKIK